MGGRYGNTFSKGAKPSVRARDQIPRMEGKPGFGVRQATPSEIAWALSRKKTDPP